MHLEHEKQLEVLLLMKQHGGIPSVSICAVGGL